MAATRTVKPHKEPYRPSCRCGKSWSGRLRCHCGRCHETFTGLASFEKHRVTSNARQAIRDCVSPQSVGLHQREDGLWSSIDHDSQPDQDDDE